MAQDPQSIALVVAGLLFIAFLLFKLQLPLVPRAAGEQARAARRGIAEAKLRFRDRQRSKQDRALALRQAAMLALEGLGRPGLAASYARRAERLDPADPESVRLVATTMRRGARFHALERLLWRRLSNGERDAGFERAYRELLALYEGPLRRPEMAGALRRLRE